MTSWPPVVYVGPSLAASDVRRWLPRCQLMPPIRRGDLYRDRLLGFRVFVILDGVFAQQLAISPRETIDVARDGGLVIGACSMGAMRAAECWPAGVQGIGSIYRLFRRGALTSDAEVAVSFSPEPPYQSISVPLINVRYALSRCLRDGLLAKSTAELVLRCAGDIFFSDRTWPLVLKSAGLPDSDGLLRALQRHDLKRLDAIRALKAVNRWIARRPSLLKDEGTVKRSGFRSVVAREEPYALHGIGSVDVSIQDLWRWLVATGRYRRYAPYALVGRKRNPRRADGASSGVRSRHSGLRSNGLPRNERTWMKQMGLEARDLALAIERSQTSVRLARLLTRPNTALARAIWADITVSGERDAIVFAFTTLTSAAQWARRCNLHGESGYRRLVTAEVALAHGFATWSELQQVLQRSPVWPWIEQSIDDTVLAKHIRQELFARSGDSGNRLALPADRE